MQHQQGAPVHAPTCQPRKTPLASSIHSTSCFPSLPLRAGKGPGSANHGYPTIPREYELLLSFKTCLLEQFPRRNLCRMLRAEGQLAQGSGTHRRGETAKAFKALIWCPPCAGTHAGHSPCGLGTNSSLFTPGEGGFPLSRASPR